MAALRGLGLATLAASLGTVDACRSPEPAPAPTPAPAPAEPDDKPTATVRELMHSVIDTSADVVWLSVRTVITKDGAVEIRPRTDEEREHVRRGALTLLESANLLMMPGRTSRRPSRREVRGSRYRARAG